MLIANLTNKCTCNTVYISIMIKVANVQHFNVIYEKFNLVRILTKFAISHPDIITESTDGFSKKLV